MHYKISIWTLVLLSGFTGLGFGIYKDKTEIR